MEKEYLRGQELKAKMALDGRADAGTPEKTPEDKAKEEAVDILKPMGY